MRTLRVPERVARGPATGRGHELPLAPDGAHPPQAGGSQRGSRRSPADERHDAVGPREETKCSAGRSNGPCGPLIFHVDPLVVCVDPPVGLVDLSVISVRPSCYF